MRVTLIITLLAAFSAEKVCADDFGWRTYLTSDQHLEDVNAVSFEYDREALTTTVEIGFERVALTLSVLNVFELPEPELPPGTGFDGSTLLSEELGGFDVDIGNERVFSLTFTVRW
ncbi:MAG: hypothetical protein QNJ19_11005 [Woeseiaceae bacterium]|nr:hypothetical protein [Woeseiaceae bacterium]